MAVPAPKEDKKPSQANNESTFGDESEATIRAEISSRQSKELVIALCGPIGSGVHVVNKQLERVLEDEGYIVHQAIRFNDYN
jgi:adenylylsulfate kinase-like enzyme